MKKYALILVALMCSGCGFGIISSNYGEMSQASIKGVTLLPQQIMPQDIARAQVLTSQAEINAALAEKIREGKGRFASTDNYTGAIINDNQKRAYVRYPNSSRIIEIAAGDSYILMTPEIPKKIYVRFGENPNFEERKVFERTKPFDGMITNYGARIY